MSPKEYGGWPSTGPCVSSVSTHIWGYRGQHPSVTHDFKCTFSSISKHAESTQIGSGRKRKLFCAPRRARVSTNPSSGQLANQVSLWQRDLPTRCSCPARPIHVLWLGFRRGGGQTCPGLWGRGQPTSPMGMVRPICRGCNPFTSSARTCMGGPLPRDATMAKHTHRSTRARVQGRAPAPTQAPGQPPITNENEIASTNTNITHKPPAPPPLPRVQRTIQSSRNTVQTELFVGHAVRYPIDSVPKPGPQ